MYCGCHGIGLVIVCSQPCGQTKLVESMRNPHFWQNLQECTHDKNFSSSVGGLVEVQLQCRLKQTYLPVGYFVVGSQYATPPHSGHCETKHSPQTWSCLHFTSRMLHTRHNGLATYSSNKTVKSLDNLRFHVDGVGRSHAIVGGYLESIPIKFYINTVA